MRTRTLAIALALALLPLSTLAGEIQFNVPGDIEKELVIGEEFSYSLCHGIQMGVPKPGERQANLNSAQSPCGSFDNPSATISGGNPPYRFMLDSGGFPPMGISLDSNGVLRGIPRGGLAANFGVCAIDLTGKRSCQRISLQPHEQKQQSVAADQAKSGGGSTALLLLGGAAAAGAGLAAASFAGGNEMTNANTCTASQTDCGDGKCCSAGHGCCGIYDGREICCSVDFPHYCPSEQTCYRTMPSCNFKLCGGVLANAPGVMVGAASAPGGLYQGDPSSSDDDGVPARLGCQQR